MSDFEKEDGTNRAELLQRVELMEKMIAEGRQSTGRWGWVFVLWGVVYFAATGWQIYLPQPKWAWPVCACLGWLIGYAILLRMRRLYGDGKNPRSWAIASVWIAMGFTCAIYGVGAGMRNDLWQPGYVSAILFFIGMAHATSALILRWRVQGAVAAIWFAAGSAMLFVDRQASLIIFLTATFFGMIVFGLYAMMQERAKLDAVRYAQHG